MNKNTAKILLVEDNAFDRAIIEKRLGKLNYEVHCAFSGKEALKKLFKVNYDIVLMDVTMEEMGGMEALQEIRKMYNANELPVVILTASNDDNCLVEAFENGSNDYLIKPINFQAMVARIESLLAIKQAAEEMHKAFLKAEEANIAKSRFLFNMTKEMKIPINSILGMSNMITCDELSIDQKRYLDIVQSSSENLLSLVSDIMEISQLEGKQLEVNEVDFNLNDSVLECFEFVINKIQKKDVDLIYYINDQVEPFVFGDEDRLKKILIHLLINAEKFTDEGEIFLHISPSAVEERIIISISDTGKGISEENLEDIFDHFVHESSDVSTKFGSYGLGLSLCKKNIELLGGDIIVESHEGQGTTFYLEVPLNKSLCAAPNVFLAEQIKKVHGLKILVIDDNQTTLQILNDKLEGWNAHVTLADSGEKGLLEILRCSKNGDNYDIILVDAVMPRMNGFDLIERINKSFSLPTQIILMLNALPDFADKHHCDTLGINFTIIKPIVDLNLVTVLNDVLKRSENIDLVKNSYGEDGKEYLGNLLVVDDMQDVIDGIVSQFEKFPVRIFTTTEGEEAINIINSQKIDVVLIDYKMPNMNGSELIKKCYDLNLETRFIMTSGYLSETEMLELLNYDDVWAIEKPFEIEKLLTLINETMAVRKKVA